MLSRLLIVFLFAAVLGSKDAQKAAPSSSTSGFEAEFGVDDMLSEIGFEIENAADMAASEAENLLHPLFDALDDEDVNPVLQKLEKAEEAKVEQIIAQHKNLSRDAVIALEKQARDRLMDDLHRNHEVLKKEMADASLLHEEKIKLESEKEQVAKEKQLHDKLKEELEAQQHQLKAQKEELELQRKELSNMQNSSNTDRATVVFEIPTKDDLPVLNNNEQDPMPKHPFFCGLDCVSKVCCRPGECCLSGCCIDSHCEADARACTHSAGIGLGVGLIILGGTVVFIGYYLHRRRQLLMLHRSKYKKMDEIPPAKWV